jgi:tRNA-dihydrouridine synthase
VLKLRSGIPFNAPDEPAVDRQLRSLLVEEENGLSDDRVDAANKWWIEVLAKPKWIMAPMVAQGERCFRLLCRQEGVGLCYTPMYLADRINTGAHDAELDLGSRSVDSISLLDRPLVCQLAGNDTTAMIQAGLRVQGSVDAVDINFGCPQICAENALIGSFLLESKPDLAVEMVRGLSKALSVPVLVKMRIQPGGVRETVRLALRLQHAGASVLTLHGRRRSQREHEGPADWATIREVKAALGIPVVANGSVQCLADAQACLAFTGADAVMSGTGLLRHPSLFSDPTLNSPSAASMCKDCISEGAIRKALANCYRYLVIVERCASSDMLAAGTDAVEVAACSGRSGGEVVAMHLMAMLQVHIMDRHMDAQDARGDLRSLCARLLNKNCFTLVMFRETLDLIAKRLLQCGLVEGVEGCSCDREGGVCPYCPPVVVL